MQPFDGTVRLMPAITHLIPLFLAAGILLAGNGIQGTLVALRADLEGFSPTVIGLLGTAYFAGFALSCLKMPVLIREVGHIRVFAALAALAAAGTLCLVLWVDPVVWLAIRFTMGFCFSGLFMVMESWINASTPNSARARVLSIYILVDLGAVTGSQFLLPVFGVAGFAIFAITAIFFCISLVPVSLADRSSPQPPAATHFSFAEIWEISPLAFISCFAVGLTNSAVRLVGPLYATGMGLDITGVALFTSIGILGGAIAQYPLGHLSDRVDRRFVMMLATAGATLAGLLLTGVAEGQAALIYAGSFLFGAFTLPLYSLSLAHANDHAASDQIIMVSAALLFSFAIGSSIGPLVASLVMERFGPPAFFAYTSIVHGLLIAVALVRIAIGPSVPEDARSRFSMLLRTSPGLARMTMRKGKPADRT